MLGALLQGTPGGHRESPIVCLSITMAMGVIGDPPNKFPDRQPLAISCLVMETQKLSMCSRPSSFVIYLDGPVTVSKASPDSLHIETSRSLDQHG
ncbi:hypothetical protein PAXRUDRAFT_835767 [Paxillus rubicundulus Ve08.2h10]|uniref:Uncharacterized protein n=1 Tax=Paxillus rubicundulus Ve08.2h10 TaxID=930991 RepID=A0A0D0CVQ1_9AGAM|nr:hypothetical protein PAXRUDRAFT_835767 [Paxillus rubicundulus Ve08.2h10]